ncbi:MAG: CinA family nicotinamide mononucleotide deamidase-related protein [Thermoguttaceae bacterium]
MQAEIISIGDELTSGKILDTNAQWLSQQLSDLGIRVLYHTTVGDEQAANVDVFRIASNRTDLIIATGGLGPTADDLTRESIAGMLGVELELKEEALESIKEMFARRGREMPVNNEKQALFPQGATVVPNPNGTAPGIDITSKRKGQCPDGLLDSFRIVALPGVPSEMKEMWKQTVRNQLELLCQSISGQQQVIRFRSIHCFGAGESQIESMLPDLVNRNHVPTVGITANRAVITLRIQTIAPSEEQCWLQMEPTAQTIYATLGSLVFGENEQTLADVVSHYLHEKKKTLSVFEWGSRGLLAESLASTVSSKEHFLGGLVVHSAESLKRTLKYVGELSTQEIPDDFSDSMIQENPAFHQQLVSLMSRVALNVFETDYSLAIGPYPAKDAGPVPVFVALGSTIKKTKGPNCPNIITESFPFGGHPAIIDDLFTKRALNLFRLRESRD